MNIEYTELFNVLRDYKEFRIFCDMMVCETYKPKEVKITNPHLFGMTTGLLLSYAKSIYSIIDKYGKCDLPSTDFQIQMYEVVITYLYKNSDILLEMFIDYKNNL